MDCLSSVLSLELMSPSPEFYLISPWLSNVVLINNRFGQFRAISRELSKDELGLIDIITLLVGRGTTVRIMCRPDHDPTQAFLSELARLKRKNIEWRQTKHLHEKGMITAHCYLRGSMNFTYAGVNLNDESIEITDNQNEIFRAQQEARVSWEGLGAYPLY
jgi:hypothetical protein